MECNREIQNKKIRLKNMFKIIMNKYLNRHIILIYLIKQSKWGILYKFLWIISKIIQKYIKELKNLFIKTR